MTTLRRVSLILLALLAQGMAPGVARAQVAAPRLTPVNPGLPSRYGLHFSALEIANPAAQTWATASRVSLGGVVEGGASGALPGAQRGAGDHGGTVAQVRVAADHAVLELTRTTSSLTLSDPGNPTDPGIALDATDRAAQLGLRFADWLGLGVGRQTADTRVRDNVLAVEDVRRRETLLSGASVRLGELLHLGYAAGSERVRIEAAQGAPGANDDADRGLTRYGIALYRAGESYALHLELYREQRDPYALPAVWPGQRFDEASLRGTTLELRGEEALLGYERITAQVRQQGGAEPRDFSHATQRVALGWVPPQGLGLVASYTRGEAHAGAERSLWDAYWLALAWMF